jgi:hypothetical protein
MQTDRQTDRELENCYVETREWSIRNVQKPIKKILKIL